MAAPRTFAPRDVEPIQARIDNTLDTSRIGDRFIAGIIGDRPSQYAKSPSIWNPAFESLGLPAVYVAFDVGPGNLGGLVAALRGSERYIGGNVTVPYKVSVMEHLDDLDEQARRIGAVNTIVRMPEGRLVGYNTDGKGAIDCLTTAAPGQRPFLESLRGKRVLMVGAGGAARAVAFYVASAIDGGTLTIANRTAGTAHGLAQAVREAYGNAESCEEAALDQVIGEVDLIINCTTKGQAGVRKLPGGRVTILEPYSGLAAANPATFDEKSHPTAEGLALAWCAASLDDIGANHRVSGRLLARAPARAAVFDIVYAPLETVLMRQARWSGHATLNGKGMNICQAADAFRRVGARFAEDDASREAMVRRALEVMYTVW